MTFVFSPDPVGTKLVASLARPGGNATGLTNFAADLIERILAAEITEAASFGGLFHFEPQDITRCPT